MVRLDYSVSVTRPQLLPVSVADAKKHLEIAESDTSHDEHIRDLLEAAVEMVEHDADRALLTQTVVEKLDCWPSSLHIEVNRWPLQSVTSIQYVDTGGDTQTWASGNYVVDTVRHVISPAYSVTYPAIRVEGTTGAITLTYVAGNTQPDIPRAALQAIKLQVAQMFEMREPVLIGSISKALEYSYDDCIQRLRRGRYPG